MDDIQKQAKEIMNKIANPFKPKFKGQGHRLGSADGSSASASTPSKGGAAGRPSASSARGVASHGAAGSGDLPSREKVRQEFGGVQRGSGSQPAKNTRTESQGVVRNDVGAQSVPVKTVGSILQEREAGVRSHEERGPFSPFRPDIASAGAAGGGMVGFSSMEPPASGKVREGPQNDQRYQCPVCQECWNSEVEVAMHVDECLSRKLAEGGNAQEIASGESKMSSIGSNDLARGIRSSSELTADREKVEGHVGERRGFWEIHQAAATIISAAPQQASLEILVKILRNISNEPSLEKFRRLRMGNPKIAELVGRAVGAMELLQAVGFELTEEGGQGAEKEVVAVMKQPDENQLTGINEAVHLLELQLPKPLTVQTTESSSGTPMFSLVKSNSASGQSSRGESGTAGSVAAVPSAKPSVLARKRDRKLRVFLPSPENMAARIEVPDSFFVRSAEEVRNEVLARKKQLENSQVLVTRAWREKQAAASKRRYSAAILRIQLPDMLVLEGVFHPSEPTSALYEFVAEALLDPSQEFQLCHPIPTRSPFIPSVATSKAAIPTLEEADLVPASLIKFRAVDIGPGGYTGLRKDLILRAEPLTSTPYPTSQ